MRIKTTLTLLALSATLQGEEAYKEIQATLKVDLKECKKAWSTRYKTKRRICYEKAHKKAQAKIQALKRERVLQ